MIATPEPLPTNVARFRARLLLAMMVVVSAVAALALYFGQRSTARGFEQELYREFQGELATLHSVQELRHAALVERCRALVRRPRIHAALEDNALDLLYPSARDELRDLMTDPAATGGERRPAELHAEFYRFLDRDGRLIPPTPGSEVGTLRPEEEARLALSGVPDRLQLGYLLTQPQPGQPVVLEVFAMPIVSTETGEIIAALVLGFRPTVLAQAGQTGIRRGLWLNGRLVTNELPAEVIPAVSRELTHAIGREAAMPAGFEQEIAGTAHLFFWKRLNPDSQYAPVYEVCVYPMTELHDRQHELRWRVLGAGAALLLGSLALSHFLAARLARPMERLAVDSAENRAQRQRAEAELELTHEELQRAARFSADASHQLKTPVTVLRAGLEELLTRENLTPDECHDISALIHQTYRLSGVIEDLLLLSRMDAGRLIIDFKPVDLTYLIETALDDLGVQADGQNLQIETNVPPGLRVEGEKRYLSVILQNLLENARKYNRPGGRIRIVVREDDGAVRFSVSNTGRPIPAQAQALIFERFHRGTMGENVPGYGLGLNLARELARLHGGELRLVRSDEDETEFELRLPPASAGAARGMGLA